MECAESEDTNFGKVKKGRLRISPNFPHMNTEELRPAESVKIECEHCILKSTLAGYTP